MQKKIYLRIQTHNLNSLKKMELHLKSLLFLRKLCFSSIKLPMQKKKFTLLRSPQANKKAKDQFEVRLYNRLFIFHAPVFCEHFFGELKASFGEDILIKLTYSVSLKCKD